MKIVYIVFVLLLTFSYSAFLKLIILISGSNEKVKNWIKRYGFLPWMSIITMLYLGIVGVGLPTFIPNITDWIVLFVLIVPFMFHANYRPHKSKTGIFAFCLAFPLVEELIFRGLLLVLLQEIIGESIIMVPFPLLKEVDLRVILTAVLFAVMHLQYFSWKVNKDTIAKMVYAFVFGIVFGNLVVMSESVLYAVLFHVTANSGATYLYLKRTTN